MRNEKLFCFIALVCLGGAIAVSSMIVLDLSSCKATVSVPGAVNSFDSATYVTLSDIQAAINQVVAINAATPLPQAQKDLLNKAIAAYDVAEAAYQAYHAALVATPPTATPAMQAALQTQVAAANAAAVALPKPPAAPVAK